MEIRDTPAQRDAREVVTDRDKLHEALMALELAAWNRSWSRLKEARAYLRLLTGIDLQGKLAEETSRERWQVLGSRLK